MPPDAQRSRKQCLPQHVPIDPASWACRHEAILSAKGALLSRSSVPAADRGKNERRMARCRLGQARRHPWRGRERRSLVSNAEIILGEGVVVNGDSWQGTLVVSTSAILEGQVTTNTHISEARVAVDDGDVHAERAIDVPEARRGTRPAGTGRTRVDAAGTLSLEAGTDYMTSLSVSRVRRSN